MSIDNIDINKIAVSNKASFGKKNFKEFLGYKDVKKIRTLTKFVLKMSIYRETNLNECLF